MFPYQIIKSNFDNSTKSYYSITINEALPRFPVEPLPTAFQTDPEYTLAMGHHKEFFRFAAIDKKHYYWSSRPSIFNAKLGLQIVDNLFIDDSAALFLEAETVKSFLPDNYDIQKIQYHDNEISYQIVYTK